MAKLAIVTDSTTNMAKDMLNGLPVHVIPLHVIWGDETYKDNVDITQDVFYERLSNSKVLPSTSQPSPQEFVDLYRRIRNDYDEILSIHISSKLSGTVDSAVQAKNMLPEQRIEVIDSLSTSMGLGHLVLLAARKANEGIGIDECKKIVDAAREKIEVFFILQTLEFLKRGGRIGGAAALLGTALNLKPILMLQDGKVETFEKVRTWQKAVHRLVEIFEEKIKGKTPVHLTVIQAMALKDAEILLKEIKSAVKESDLSEIFISGISPVIGTHAGPGAIGICFLPEN